VALSSNGPEKSEHRALLAALERASKVRIAEIHAREAALGLALAAAVSERDRAQRERDVMIAALQRIEARRAELMRMTLKLAALQRRCFRGRSARQEVIKQMVEAVLAIEVRPLDRNPRLKDGKHQ